MRFQRLALAGIIGAAATFAPQQLFAFGEQGAVYDPSDIVNYLGAELVTNGTFLTNLAGWTDLSTPAGVISWNAAAGGCAQLTRTDAGNARMGQPLATIPGRTYTITATGLAVGGGMQVGVGTGAGLLDVLAATGVGAGANAFSFVALGAVSHVSMRTTQLGTSQFNAFSVREVPALASMFQDSAGTTPVTAVGQPVGLILDTRLGAVRGAEMWSDAAAVLTGEATRVSPGVYRILTTAGVFSSVGGNFLTLGKNYEILFNIDSITVAGGGVAVDPLGSVFTTLGPKRLIVTGASAITFNVKRGAAVATDIQVSGVSIRELPGNHATQPTAASRPVLSARYNKCTNSNANPVDLTGVAKSGDAAAVLSLVDDSAALAAAGLSGICTSGKVYKLDNSAGVASAFVGFAGAAGNTNSQVGSATLRAAGGTGARVQADAGGGGSSAFTTSATYSRLSATLAAVAGTQCGLAVTAGCVCYFILNDLREACDAYLPTQVVTAAGAYDTVGFPYYLSFDGVDDFLVTTLPTPSAGMALLAATPLTVTTATPLASGGQSAAEAGVGIKLRPDGSVWTRKGDGAVNTTTTTPVGAFAVAPIVLGSAWNPTLASVYAGPVNATGAAAADPASVNVFHIGRANSSTSVYEPYAGRVYGVILRSVATDPGVILTAARYLSQKMRLAV